VLPGKTFHRTSDVSATIVGRSLFAAPPRVRLTETENAVLKALANDDCGDFFLCGVLDYEFEFGVSSKLVLDEIEATMRADNCLPGFVDKAIEQRAGEVLKRMGYVN
jgi:hypothetical protein